MDSLAPSGRLDLWFVWSYNSKRLEPPTKSSSGVARCAVVGAHANFGQQRQVSAGAIRGQIGESIIGLVWSGMVDQCSGGPRLVVLKPLRLQRLGREPLGWTGATPSARGTSAGARAEQPLLPISVASTVQVERKSNGRHRSTSDMKRAALNRQTNK